MVSAQEVPLGNASPSTVLLALVAPLCRELAPLVYSAVRSPRTLYLVAYAPCLTQTRHSLTAAAVVVDWRAGIFSRFRMNV